LFGEFFALGIEWTITNSYDGLHS